MTTSSVDISNDSNENNTEEAPLSERVVKISRVAKVVKGGRNLRFSAVVVVGNGLGRVGIGSGKSESVPDAVKKASTKAQQNMVSINLKNDTIPHVVKTKFCSSEVLLMPASSGTGVIAGGAVRAVVEVAGIKDILTKVRRSSNPVNAAKAALKGLQLLKDPEIETQQRRLLISK
jgi:small subunit ribosomal protein S5